MPAAAAVSGDGDVKRSEMGMLVAPRVARAMPPYLAGDLMPSSERAEAQAACHVALGAAGRSLRQMLAHRTFPPALARDIGAALEKSLDGAPPCGGYGGWPLRPKHGFRSLSLPADLGPSSFPKRFDMQRPA